MKNPDGYAGIFPIYNNYSWVEQNERKAANDFLASIGERNYGGVKGFIQKYGQKIAPVFQFAIALVGTLLTGGVGGAASGYLAKYVSGQFKGEMAKILNAALVQLPKGQLLENLVIPIYQEPSFFKDALSRTNGLSFGSKDFLRSFLVGRWYTYRPGILGETSYNDVETAKNWLTLAIGKVAFVYPYDDPRMSKVRNKYSISTAAGHFDPNAQVISEIWLEAEIVQFMETFHQDKPSWTAKERDEMRAIAAMIAGLEVDYDQQSAEKKIEDLTAKLEEEKKKGTAATQFKAAGVTGLAAIAIIGLVLSRLGGRN